MAKRRKDKRSDEHPGDQPGGGAWRETVYVDRPWPTPENLAALERLLLRERKRREEAGDPPPAP